MVCFLKLGDVVKVDVGLLERFGFVVVLFVVCSGGYFEVGCDFGVEIGV